MQYPQNPLTFVRVSIAAAIATIVLKFGAYALTHSVGLLSDAIEAFVNLAAALGALWALTAAARPPDERYHFGQAKAEFLIGFRGGPYHCRRSSDLWILKGARIHRSITLEAGAKHLMADVWTSLAVLAVFSWDREDGARGRQYG